MRVTVKKAPIVIPGFRFSGVACGLKPSGKKDLSLLMSEVPATAVAAFTTNQVKAAPVLIGEERIRGGRLQAIVVNSGNANASTAQPGLKLAHDTCALVGRELNMDPQLVLPSSTGVIGVLPKWKNIQTGIRHAAEQPVAPRLLECCGWNHDNRRLSQSRGQAGSVERKNHLDCRHGQRSGDD